MLIFAHDLSLPACPLLPSYLQAALCGRAEVARVLIAHGADSRSQDRSGNTAVHLAGLGGHLVLLSELLQVGLVAAGVESRCVE